MQNESIDNSPVPKTEQSTPVEQPGLFVRSLSRLWRGLLLFLEIIGLRRGTDVDHAAQLARLRLYHTEFRKLLSSNNSFLESLGELEGKLLRYEFIDRAYVKRKVVRLMTDIHAMSESLNVISGDRYAGLRDAFERVSNPLVDLIEETCEPMTGELVLDLPSIRHEHSELVGGKMSNLSELANTLGLPTPDGMTVTTEAYRFLIEEGGIRSWIQNKHLELISPEDVEAVSESLRERILALPVPPQLEKAILEAYDRMTERIGRTVNVAVRSSAIGEDSDFSFAGQFLSLLNVPRDRLCSAYLKVAASLYSPEAMHYRLLHGIPGETALMAVGFVAMVDAVASGVVFSRDPNDQDSGLALIQAVRGLGVLLVDGATSPEILHMSRGGAIRSISRTGSSQTTQYVFAGDSGIREAPLQPDAPATQCVSDDHAIRLLEWALRIEDHFGCTQDIEWALDSQERLILLQARPLRLSVSSSRSSEPAPGHNVLLAAGETGCPGVAAGPAVHMADDEDMESFPEAGVLVARRSSPRFVRLMSKACAIVTDAGSTTGHMASLAREMRVPTLLNTKSAVQSIPNGAIVTVDAGSCFVYEGEVKELIDRYAAELEEAQMSTRGRSTPGYRFLKKIVELTSPLNLTDPASTSFAPEGCLTLHDIARFVHEKSYREMFSMGNNVGDLRASSYYLDIALPLDLYIIDLGGGFASVPKHNKVRRSLISSTPLNALLKGMMHEKIPRFGPKPMDLGGFFSIMMRHAVTSPEEEASFREPCYAMISDKYLNYTARVGYHFNVLDAYCGDTTNKNYISMVFQGGAADFVRRCRRARSIAGILKEYGFSVKVNNDKVDARLSKAPKEETIKHLEMMGSLFQFFRQMDAAMTSEDAVDLFRDAFLKGDYALEHLSGD